jgi:hypothetical protein
MTWRSTGCAHVQFAVHLRLEEIVKMGIKTWIKRIFVEPLKVDTEPSCRHDWEVIEDITYTKIHERIVKDLSEEYPHSNASFYESDSYYRFHTDVLSFKKARLDVEKFLCGECDTAIDTYIVNTRKKLHELHRIKVDEIAARRERNELAKRMWEDNDCRMKRNK